MSINKATFGAIVFSGATLLSCLFAISSIYSDVQSIWAELDTEIDSFKVIADDLWKDMLVMGAGSPSNRQRRQAYEGYSASQSAGPHSGPNDSINQPIGQAPHLPANNGVGSGSNSNSHCRKFLSIKLLVYLKFILKIK